MQDRRTKISKKAVLPAKQGKRLGWQVLLVICFIGFGASHHVFLAKSQANKGSQVMAETSNKKHKRIREPGRFSPSQKIKADQAVAFPADI